MLTFKEYEYRRPDVDAVFKKFKEIIEKLGSAESYADAKAAVSEMAKLYNEISTMASLARIRNSIDTSDAFYETEQEFWDEAWPRFEEYITLYYKAMIESVFKVDIEREYGRRIIDIANIYVKKFSPEIISDMQEENKLSSEYQKLLASCKVDFKGETVNIYGLLKRMQDPDRAIRKEAYEKWAGFFTENEQKLDELYDKLVHLRARMGQKMGFPNFIPLAYLKMGRSDYGPEDVSEFRKQVLEEIVPVCTELRKRQAKRIGVDKLKYYDESFAFTDGNAVPNGDRDFMVSCAEKMYRELSPETGEFFGFMVKSELLELESKPNKAFGGYCDFLPLYNAPFIFSNFNGTSADVDVLTHEAGHAFESFCSSKRQPLPEYLFSTSEIDEIHSMSMEYFAYPWMDLFFGGQVGKYHFSHMAESLLFIPYGVLVDEFQHRIYEDPDMTPAERKALWHELEKKYLPHRDYDGNDFMERGGIWQRQIHIYMMPFYYIDYTLASMGAFEFFGKMNEDREKAWNDYYRLCCAGGSLPYLDLLKLANLSNPFEPGSVKRAIAYVVKRLRETDDMSL